MCESINLQLGSKTLTVTELPFCGTSSLCPYFHSPLPYLLLPKQ